MWDVEKKETFKQHWNILLSPWDCLYCPSVMTPEADLQLYKTFVWSEIVFCFDRWMKQPCQKHTTAVCSYFSFSNKRHQKLFKKKKKFHHLWILILELTNLAVWMWAAQWGKWIRLTFNARTSVISYQQGEQR